MVGLCVGRDVHFVLPGGAKLAAKLTLIWDDVEGMVNLVAFANGRELIEPASKLYQSATYDPTGEKPFTWHWPIRV